MTPLEEHLEKIARTKNELRTARPGPHKRDLARCLSRLQKELLIYDSFRTSRAQFPGTRR